MDTVGAGKEKQMTTSVYRSPKTGTLVQKVFALCPFSQHQSQI